jgi:hypothetical protein
MNEQTNNRRLDQLLRQVNTHPFREELLNIMSQQLVDDTNVVQQEMFNPNMA